MTAPIESVSFVVGSRFGRWTVIGELVQKSRYQKYAPCRCDCGRVRDVWCPDLRTGGSTQCRSCSIAERSTKHGHAKRGERTREYRSWRHMNERCFNRKCPAWPDYGGRGISVCPEWAASFEQFYAYMGPCPTGCSIDRIDNARGYEPGNVRWADSFTQAQNRTMTVYITHEGRTACIAEWARLKGIKPATLSWRIRQGWTAERALAS